MTPTNNYCKFTEVIANDTSVYDIVRLKEFVCKLGQALNPDNTPEEAQKLRDECAIEWREETAWLFELADSLETVYKCPRCGKPLYLSDLAEYNYFCLDCDENFYEFELKKGNG